jgi:glucose/arabinose dehydrogenase
VRSLLLAAALAALLAPGCGGSSGAEPAEPSIPLEVTEVARGLDTVWSLAFDPQGRLWFTEREGRLTRLGEPSVQVEDVAENGEAGLMGLEIDGEGRFYVMYTAESENRVVRLEPDGSQTVLVDGIAAAGIHDGGRIRFGPDGALYVSTGDAGESELAQDAGSRNGRILRVDPDSGDVSIFSAGHRNAQGLCFAPDGRFYATEHGPDEGDEINILTEGSNGG